MVFKDFSSNKNITTLFAGDSHVELAIDDRLIPNSRCVGNNSEIYYFTYYKLEGLMRNSPSVKRIYLGFSYHNLSHLVDEYAFGKYSTDLVSRFFYILPGPEKIRFLKHNINDLPIFSKNILKNGIHISFLGQYENLFTKTSAVKKSMEKRISNQFYDERGKLYRFSDFSMAYLDTIVKLCQEKNVELIFLKTPLHQYYQQHVPESYIKKYDSLLKNYNLPLVEFDSMNLDDRYFAPDGDHVSAEGAIVISKWFANQ